jgi:phytanoyl-CoA hydroxylase
MEIKSLPTEKTLTIASPTGSLIEIPVDYDETDFYLTLKTPDQIREYYKTNGYVIQRNVIPPELCDQAKAGFDKEVKPYKGAIYRQSGGDAEKHKFSERKFMLNGVLNVQDLDSKVFGQFQSRAIELLTHPNIKRIVEILMQEEAIIAQTMFFEGNPVTWPHQDKDYLDANTPGSMVAAWVAVEDIHPGAGRFYVYPGSHNIAIDKVGSNVNIILDREAYKKLVVETIKGHDFECKAPAMRKGDVLLWHGKTIHGSLSTTHPEYSRSSFTAHYMPVSKSLLQLQVRQKKLNLRNVKGMKVNFPKDQNQFINKMVLLLEDKFPTVYRSLKARAIKLYQRS